MHGVLLGIVVLGVVIVALLLAAAAGSRGRFQRIARCRSGHLFTSTVIPGESLKAIRLWTVRFQRCPVGNHWTLVSWVDASILTPEELADAQSRHDVRLP